MIRRLAGVLAVVLVATALLIARPAPKVEAGVTAAELDATVLATLNEIDAHGWNPRVRGLYINWSLQGGRVNLPDANPSRHDELTDLRDLVNMVWYEHRHPGDQTQQSSIARLTPSVMGEFRGYASRKGWVYWQFLQLAQLTSDPFWAREARGFAAHLFATIDPALGVAHAPVTASTAAGAPTCPDGYRIDHALESGLALSDAGKRFGLPAWSAAGAREVAVVTAAGFSPADHLFNRIVCRGRVWDGQAKIGEQAETILAFLDAGSYTGNHTYLARAREMLDGLVANRTGLHDTRSGGFFFAYDLTHRVLRNSYKEPRQLTLLSALHRADGLFKGGYAALEAEMATVAVRMQSLPPMSGYFYRETPTFHQFPGENWITTEAGGIAAEAIQSVLSPAPGPTPTPTPSPTPSPSDGPGNLTITRTIAAGASQSVFVAVPGGGVLTALLSWTGAAHLTLTVYNGQGTKVYSTVTGVNDLVIQLIDLRPGRYKVKVRDGGTTPATYSLHVLTRSGGE